MGAGHGGQILVAESSAGLVHGLELRALGSRRLRDLAAPVELFQVLAEGLSIEFPPVRTLDATPGNLKAQVGSFLGRAAELADVQAALRTHRLVTLTGVGGVGKTRLALQVAAEVAPDFPEGVFVAELAEVGDPNAVAGAVASVLGVMQQPGRTIAGSVADALADRERLLVLDNCEHVLDAVADLVEKILATSGTPHVLATSREGLRVGDELVWTVPSLTTGDAGSDAVALFLERAQSAVRTFSPRPADVEVVAEICERLDGIPLAIELAASRMVSLSPVDLRDRLDDRFRLLSGSRRGLERHQTLRQTVQWSYELLDFDEQSLLHRCSVFAGSFDLAAAFALAPEGVDEYQVLDLLEALARKSLLVVDRVGPTSSYSMLETIRQFAEEQLVESGDASLVRHSHASLYQQRILDAVQLWDGPAQLTAYERFHADFANLRAAFGWAADTGDLDVAATIVTRCSFLGMIQLTYEPSNWAERIVGAARAADHRALPGVLGAFAWASVSGEVDRALVAAAEGLALLSDPRYEREPFDYPYLALTVPYFHAGLLESAVAAAAEYRRHQPHVPWSAQEVIALAMIGRTAEAAALSADTLRAAKEVENPYLELDALVGVVFALRDQDPEQALLATRKALASAQALEAKVLEVSLLEVLIQLEAQCGEPIAALDAAQLAIQHYLDSGNNVGLRNALGILAKPLERLGHLTDAAPLIGYAGGGAAAQAVWPEISAVGERLRAALGVDTYESLAADGEAMTRSAIVRHALAAIDQAATTEL
jgi:predicted ATPase